MENRNKCMYESKTYGGKIWMSLASTVYVNSACEKLKFVLTLS